MHTLPVLTIITQPMDNPVLSPSDVAMGTDPHYLTVVHT